MYSHERKWLKRLAILNDYVRVPYANGSSYASQFLYREMSGRGVDVTVVGPNDPNAKPEELPPRQISMPSIPIRNQPGLYLAMPSRASLEALKDANFDMVLAQSPGGLLYAGRYLREQQGVPLVCVNTLHMPSVYNTVLPDVLNQVGPVNRLFTDQLIPLVESESAKVYNSGEALVCLSPGLEKYWRDRGVTVPIHVIPRAIETRVFDQTGQDDPFSAESTPGARLIVVCRHVREKEVDRLLRIFARYIYPRVDGVTLTLVGDGPEHEALQALAKELRIDHRTHFVGEQSLHRMPAWYRNADLFAYTSLSETYGQVVSEALWCGLPVVAMDDGMGVAGQVTDGEDGFLVDPNTEGADEEFGHHVELLLNKAALRRQMSANAVRNAKVRSDPEECVQRYLEVFEVAKDHARRNPAPASKKPYSILAYWTALHATYGAMGLLRKPGGMNRNQATTGSWTFATASRTDVAASPSAI